MLDISGLSPQFPSFFHVNNSIASAWIVSRKESHSTDSIHRFFDSSPFSPSNRYIVYTELPTPHLTKSRDGRELRYETWSQYATVLMVDLKSGERIDVGGTLAWGSQVGAHPQWGSYDNHLYYNSFGEYAIFNLSKPHQDASPQTHKDIPFINYDMSLRYPVGVAYNHYSKKKRILQCPIYHISPDGLYGVAPNLYKIGNTQQGYGIPLEQITKHIEFRPEGKISVREATELTAPHMKASKSDGLYLTTLATGGCQLLISLYDIAKLVGFDTKSTPMYGFHAKWSADSRLIMFVVRTMELGVPSWMDRMLFRSPMRVRVQHLFVLSRQHPTQVKHVISWASKPFISAVNGEIVSLSDGNHPNWIPFTSKPCSNETTCDSSKWHQCDEGTQYKISMNLQTNHEINRRGQTRFQLVEFDVSKYFSCVDSPVATFKVNEKIVPKVVYAIGSGHPTYHISGRYVVTDAYMKEKDILPGKILNYKVPLRLIDLHTQSEQQILYMNLLQSSKENVDIALTKLFTSTKIDNSWRCDMHPAWSRDYQWLAVNGRTEGRHRQVLIVHIGSNVAEFFTHGNHSHV